MHGGAASVGIPTLPVADVAVSIPCNNLTQNPQCLPISEISRSRDFGAFSRVFQPRSEICSLVELTISELWTPGLTPHRNSTKTSADHSLQKSAQYRENIKSQRKSRNVQLRVLSVFADPEHAPKVQEGAALLPGAPPVHVKEVDVSTLQLDKHKKLDASSERVAVKRAASGFRRRLCFTSWPVTTQGETVSVRNKKRVNDAVTTETAFLLVLALATLTQNNTGLVMFASKERGEAHFGEPCWWWQTEDVRLFAELGASRGAFYSCELVKRWTNKSCVRPGCMGVMTNFRVHCQELKEGWPQISNPDRSYSGPLSNRCKACQKQQKHKTPRWKQQFVHTS